MTIHPLRFEGRAPLQLFLTGDFRLQMGETWVCRPMRRDVRLLWGYLGLHRGKQLDRERVAFVLWPDVPETKALQRLRRMLYELRQDLNRGSDTIYIPLVVGSQSITLAAGPELEIDVEIFNNACTDLELLAGGEASVIRMLEEVIRKGAEPLLQEFQGEEWLAHAQTAHSDRLLTAMVTLRDRYAELDALDDATRCGAGAVTCAPLSERASGEMMRLLSTAGLRLEALSEYRRCASTIYEELKVSPAPWLTELRDAIARSATHRELDRIITRLEPKSPSISSKLFRPMSSFFGRDEEISRIDKAFGVGRLVCILGPGGFGKTRLAIESAWAMEEHFPDGIWCLELDQITRSEGVPIYLGQTMELSFQGESDPLNQLQDSIGRKRALLVLDNCEHVIDGVRTTVKTLLEGCPRLSILLTSRQVLGLDGEWILHLTPLNHPANDSLRADEDLRSLSSIRLFIDRMQGGRSGAALSRAEVIHIANICRIVEGIPLAIELAAARATFLPLDYIEEGLQQQPFTILGGGKALDRPERHETLWNTIDWSYRLLDPIDRTLFSLLSIFPKDFTVSSAVEVCLPLLRVAHETIELNRPDIDARINWLSRCSMVVSSIFNDAVVRDGSITTNNESYTLDSDELQDQLTRNAQNVPAGTSDKSQLQSAGEYSREGGLTGDSPSIIGETELQNLRTREVDGRDSLDLDSPHSEADLFESSSPRFTMYVTVRHYAMLRLGEVGAIDETLSACAAYYVGMATMAENGLASLQQTQWMMLLHSERGNIRGVMEWLTRQSNWRDSLQIAVGLSRYWYQTDAFEFESRWLETILRSYRADSRDASICMNKARHGLALLKYGSGRLGEAENLLQQVIVINEEFGDSQNKLLAQYHLAIVFHASGRLRNARDAYLQCIDGFAAIGDEKRANEINGLLARIEHRSHSVDIAATILESCRCELSKYQPSIFAELSILEGLSFALTMCSEFEHAIKYAQHMIDLSSKLHLRAWTISGLVNLALALRHSGKSDLALQNLDKAFRASKEIGSLETENLVCYHLGLAYLELNDTKRAGLFLARALNIAQIRTSNQDYYYALAALAESAEQASNPIVAEFVEMNPNSFEEKCDENLELMGRILRAIGYHRCLFSPIAASLRLIMEASHIFVRLGMTHDLLRSMDLMAVVLVSWRMHSHAFQIVNSTSEIRRILGISKTSVDFGIEFEVLHDDVRVRDESTSAVRLTNVELELMELSQLLDSMSATIALRNLD